jgi:hypothetical protein
VDVNVRSPDVNTVQTTSCASMNNCIVHFSIGASVQREVESRGFVESSVLSFDHEEGCLQSTRATSCIEKLLTSKKRRMRGPYLSSVGLSVRFLWKLTE